MPYVIYRGEEVFASLSNPILGNRYTIVQPNGQALPTAQSQSVTINTLGGGGFGQVVRARDSLGLDRAVKLISTPALLRPAGDPHHSELYAESHIPSPTDAQVISSRYRDEIRNTNVRPFQRILPIIDYSSLSDLDGRDLIFCVSPYVPGSTLGVFITNQFTTPSPFDRLIRNRLHDVVLNLIDDILAGLDELSDAQVVHMDIKPHNLMVLPSLDASQKHVGRTERLFIIDLGAARSWSSLEGDPYVPLIKTNYYFPVEMLFEELEVQSDYIRLASLKQHGTTIDLYCVGRTLELLFLDRVRRRSRGVVINEKSIGLVSSEPAKELQWRTIFSEDFEILEGLIDRLLKTDHHKFPSAADARLAFQAVNRSYSQSHFASKALTDQTTALKIRVGSSIVRIATPFDRIIDHPTFQRLKKLQQLVFLHEVYPEATHTRFAHLLITYNVTKRFLISLHRDTLFRLAFTKQDVDHVLAAALIHDIGQYSFSHTIEDLRKIGDVFGIPRLSAIKHDQELALDYMSLPDDNNVSINRILEDAGYSPESIVYMFQKGEKQSGRLIGNIGRDLVSGAIDVDRVSYLLHDSYRSGVAFGRVVDLSLLIDSLCIRRDEGTGELAVGVDSAGQSAVEAVLAAVYWMYFNVYWHHSNRGFMACVKYVMRQLLESGTITFEQYHKSVFGKTDVEALVYLQQEYRKYNEMSSRVAFDPFASLLSGKRFAYRRVYTLPFEQGERGKWYLAITHASPDKIDSFVEGIARSLPSGSNVLPGEILVDIPYKKRLFSEGISADEENVTASEKGVKAPIWVRKRDKLREINVWKQVDEVSPLSRLLGSVEDSSGRKVRVFFSRQLLERLPRAFIAKIGDCVQDEMLHCFGGRS